jgi:hypothetical protein
MLFSLFILSACLLKSLAADKHKNLIKNNHLIILIIFKCDYCWL